MAEERYTSRHTGQEIDDAVDAVANKADVTNIGGAKHLEMSQVPIVSLQSIEQVDDTNGENNKMWWSTDDGKLKYKHNGQIYVLADTPPYMLYYCGSSVYKWNGSAFMQVGGGNVINSLNTGGIEVPLSAEMGKMLKAKINEVYTSVQNLFSSLGEIAFWNGKPNIGTILPDLDWSVTKHNVLLSLLLTHSVVKHNGIIKENGSSIQVEEGEKLTLIVAPESNDYALNSVTANVGGTPISPIDNGDGTYKVELIMGQVDVALSITANAIGAPQLSISPNALELVAPNGSTAIGTLNVHGSDLLGNVSVDVIGEGLTICDTENGTFGSSITLSPTSGSVNANVYVKWAAGDDDVLGTITASTQGANNVVADVSCSNWYTAPKDDVLDANNNVVKYGMQQGRSIFANNGLSVDGTIENGAKPGVIMSPAGYDESVKISCGTGRLANTNPGKTTANYFATGGKRYMHIKITGHDTTKFYKTCIGLYGDAVIGNSQDNVISGNVSIDGKKGRLSYVLPNVETSDGSLQWKTDLLSGGATGVTYVKLLMAGYESSSSGVAIDSRLYYDDIVVKYSFSDT